MSITKRLAKIAEQAKANGKTAAQAKAIVDRAAHNDERIKTRWFCSVDGPHGTRANPTGPCAGQRGSSMTALEINNGQGITQAIVYFTA
jgi:hypothetical protein